MTNTCTAYCCNSYTYNFTKSKLNSRSISNSQVLPFGDRTFCLPNPLATTATGLCFPRWNNSGISACSYCVSSHALYLTIHRPRPHTYLQRFPPHTHPAFYSTSSQDPPISRPAITNQFFIIINSSNHTLRMTTERTREWLNGWLPPMTSGTHAQSNWRHDQQINV